MSQMSISVEYPVQSRSQADWGYEDDQGWHYYRRCLVDPDGSVWAWDEIAQSYSRDHDLTDDDLQAIREMADPRARLSRAYTEITGASTGHGAQGWIAEILGDDPSTVRRGLSGDSPEARRRLEGWLYGYEAGKRQGDG